MYILIDLCEKINFVCGSNGMIIYFRVPKEASQKRWLRKPENQNYFRGPENVRRVQEWRIANPGYSCRKKRYVTRTLL